MNRSAPPCCYEIPLFWLPLANELFVAALLRVSVARGRKRILRRLPSSLRREWRKTASDPVRAAAFVLDAVGSLQPCCRLHRVARTQMCMALDLNAQARAAVAEALGVALELTEAKHGA